MIREGIASLFLLCALAAQEPGTTAPPKPPETIATLRSGHMEAVFGLAQLAGMEAPVLEDGEHFVVTLDSTGAFRGDKAKGKCGFFEAVGDPGAAMKLYEKQLEPIKAAMKGAMVMEYRKQALDPAGAEAMADGMFAFPAMIGRLSIKLDGQFDAPPPLMQLEVRATPAKDSELAAAVGRMQPSKAGVPVLDDKGAIMSMRYSLDTASVADWFKAMCVWSVDLLGLEGEQRDQVLKMYLDSLTLYDGSGAFVLGGPKSGTLLFGVTDAAAVTKMMGSDAYKASIKAQSNAGVSVKVTDNVLTHRDASLNSMKLVGTDEMPMPFEFDLQMGACGPYMLASLGGAEASKALIDRILDQKIARAPLAGNVLMDLNMDMARMMEMLGMPFPEQAPAKAFMSIAKDGGDLVLRFDMK